MAAVFRNRRDVRIHFYNIKQAWGWTLSDIKWLILMGLSTVFRKIRLPEQGKFNAAEKLNFMIVMGTYPLYIMTGLLMWFTYSAVLAWILHVGMALIATPFLIGHIFMATLNPSTRKGLQGMISGFVDRQWAKHHYGDWYREQNDVNTQASEDPSVSGDQEPADRRIPHSPSLPEVPPPVSAHEDPQFAETPLSVANLHSTVNLPDNFEFGCPKCLQQVRIRGEILAQSLVTGTNHSCPRCGGKLTASYMADQARSEMPEEQRVPNPSGDEKDAPPPVAAYPDSERVKSKTE
jgi:hypothetical protein